MAGVPRLFVILDAAVHGRDLDRLEELAAVLGAVPRGMAALLERDRDGGAGDQARLGRLRRLRAVCDATGARLVVSQRVDLALAAGADGVQLPESGLGVAEARAVARRGPGTGPRIMIGRSCHDRAGLVAAAADGADWAFLAPVFAPHSKRSAAPPLGVAGFATAAAGLALPVVALGGILPEHVQGLRAAGAHGVATIGAIVGTSDAAERAARFADWLG